MYEYENVRRVSYPDSEYGTAVFVPVCEKCGRFVKALPVIHVGDRGLKDEPTAECSRCGPTTMPFEGFF